MSNNRPIYISFAGLPITAITSISHRISGMIMFGAVPILLWMLSASVESEASFNELSGLLGGFFPKLILWAIIASFTFHVVAGIKHLLMDVGIGESWEGGRIGAILTLCISAVLILAEGVWLLCL